MQISNYHRVNTAFSVVTAIKIINAALLLVSFSPTIISILPLHHKVIYAVNQQILAAIKFGVSQNKAIYVNLAAIKFGVSPRPTSMQCTIDVYVLAATNISERHAIRQIRQI